ncbi:MAG: TIGR01777 family oxidoreductase [Bacteroidetes bacterium]|nr:TIGR01777 family oxidoreductase [Bacteroidota bacterium]
MKEVVLITGAHGMIAKELAHKLSNSFDIRMLSREPSGKNEFLWDINTHFVDEKAFENVAHIIHLSGANVIEKKWTDSRKSEIVSSRVKSAGLLLEILQQRGQKIKTFISASAIGFYGNETSQRVFTEEDIKGEGFLSDVVLRWEQAADSFEVDGFADRVVKLRIGIVLSPKDGALPKMCLSVKSYMGAAFGSGNQYMPWIHIDDICAIYEFALKNSEMKGVYNAVAPEQPTNKEFTKALAKVLNKPLFMPNIPSFLMKMVLGESASALLEGTRVSPEKIMKLGYRFIFPDLNPALYNLLIEK